MLAMPRFPGRLVCFMVGVILLMIIPALIQAEEYEPGQIIVKFIPQINKLDVRYQHGVTSVGITSIDRRMEKYEVGRVVQLFPHKRSELGRIYQLDFSSQHDAKSVAEDFAHDEHLLYAVTRQIKRLCDLPNDEYYLSGRQWYLNTVQAPQAWDIVHGDSSVIIAIVDTGVDWDHPDLWAHIWVNPGEDLDGDGYITFPEWNNSDDDGNGYVDDFFGWDFGGSGHADNDPNEHASIHGTHCAGIAAAVTNNALGVAGMAWDATIMAVKTSVDGEDGIRYGYQGILYAADNGADVISLSWGNRSTSAYEQEVIDSAFASGAIIVAAAGNDPPCSPPDVCPTHYPSGNDHVIAVAATDVNDNATGWTYYGDWVDVAAPGSQIYNTWYDDSYTILQGTSMSCPLVAGAAGLLKALDADMTSDEFEVKMRFSSDDISHINPEYVGWLGGGRLNAYAAILSMTQPRVVLEDEWIIEDADGNEDGRPDPGETIDWTVTCTNLPSWQLAEDVVVRVSNPDESIVFLQDSVSLGNIPAGSSVENSAAPLQFTVEEDADVHWTTFYFQIQANAGKYAATDSLEMLIGRPDVLLVDDDGGDDQEMTYRTDLEKLSVIYDLWSVAEVGKIDAQELNLYRAVIWLTETEAESTLTTEDQDHLGTFLDAGNHLFLTGENIGDEIGAGAFFSDYLHVAHVADTVSSIPPELEGVDGDVISDGARIFLWGETGPIQSASAIQSLGGAVDIFTYRNNPQEYVAATRYESNKGFKVVYFAFGYRGIREAGNYTPGRDILENILNWFDIETNPVAVDQDQMVATGVPQQHLLSQNYPNPFNAETSIEYILPQGSEQRRTTLRIYNLLGQQVRTLVDGIQRPGAHIAEWDGRDASGRQVSTAVYFYRLESGDFTQTRRMVLLR